MKIKQMENLKGKKLLLLGGSIWKQAIFDFAKQYDIVLIATGKYTDAGIFEIADECYNIDSTDIEAMKCFIKEKNIDGVYVGGNELIIAAAIIYLEELNMPCYCTRAQWGFLQDKSNFKDLCIKFGLPVVQKYDIDIKTISYSAIDFPVITKPVDGCGSSGFSVCHNIDELKQGYQIASLSSPTGNVLVEKFVKNTGVVAFYTFSNGVIHYSGLEDKYPVKYEKQGSYVGGLFVFESKLSVDFREKYENKIRLMFESIGLKEGSLWIEVFHNGENYYFNEAGYRYGGSISIYPVDYFHGINQVAADIYYALTGQSCIEGHESLIKAEFQRKKYYSIYPIYVAEGKIDDIVGVAEIEKLPNLVLFSITKKVGSLIKDSGSFSQNFALAHFVFDTLDECKRTIENIHSLLKVVNANGHNMIKKMLNWEELDF